MYCNLQLIEIIWEYIHIGYYNYTYEYIRETDKQKEGNTVHILILIGEEGE